MLKGVLGRTMTNDHDALSVMKGEEIAQKTPHTLCRLLVTFPARERCDNVFRLLRPHLPRWTLCPITIICLSKSPVDKHGHLPPFKRHPSSTVRTLQIGTKDCVNLISPATLTQVPCLTKPKL